MHVSSLSNRANSHQDYQKPWSSHHHIVFPHATYFFAVLSFIPHYLLHYYLGLNLSVTSLICTSFFCVFLASFTESFSIIFRLYNTLVIISPLFSLFPCLTLSVLFIYHLILIFPRIFTFPFTFFITGSKILTLLHCSRLLLAFTNVYVLVPLHCFTLLHSSSFPSFLASWTPAQVHTVAFTHLSLTYITASPT